MTAVMAEGEINVVQEEGAVVLTPSDETNRFLPFLFLFSFSPDPHSAAISLYDKLLLLLPLFHPAVLFCSGQRCILILCSVWRLSFMLRMGAALFSWSDYAIVRPTLSFPFCSLECVWAGIWRVQSVCWLAR